MPSTKVSVETTTKKSRRGRITVPVVEPRAETPQKIAAATKGNSRPRLSALDAAAELLGGLTAKEAAVGLGAKDLIERMEKARLWQSPGGKTPSATLYSALIREITQRKANSRFKRITPGKFSLATTGRAGRKSRTGREGVA